MFSKFFSKLSWYDDTPFFINIMCVLTNEHVNRPTFYHFPLLTATIIPLLPIFVHGKSEIFDFTYFIKIPYIYLFSHKKSEDSAFFAQIFLYIVKLFQFFFSCRFVYSHVWVQHFSNSCWIYGASSSFSNATRVSPVCKIVFPLGIISLPCRSILIIRHLLGHLISLIA